MSEISKNREEKQLALDKIKNKKLVKILNQKMFKGYRDIKRSKLFYKLHQNKTKNVMGCMEWEKKVYDYFEDLYNINYKLTFLSKLKTPNIDNIMYVKHYPKNFFAEQISTSSNNDSKIKPTSHTLNTLSSSNKNQNLTTIGSLLKKNNKTKKKKVQTSSKNNFYLTSMSIYHTDNFYHDYKPEKVYKEIFDNDNIYYNDIPILSLEKINKYNIPKKTKRSKYIHSDEEIIQTNNEKDNLYNGLTERQFLYKISHNKSNKNINEKVNVNSFIKNKGVIKGYNIQRLKSAALAKRYKSGLFNKNLYSPKNVNIETGFNKLGGLEVKKIFMNNLHDYNFEKVFDKRNQFLVYNTGTNTDNSSTNNKSKSKLSPSYSDNKMETEDKIFGNPFKDIKPPNKNEEPPVQIFQNKPRIFDDKLLIKYQLHKKNQFLKLKNIMS